MRKIVVFNLISIDGFFAGPGGDISWHNVDDEFNKFGVEQTASFGTIIFGRKTYELFEGYWPKVLKDPTASNDDRKIAQILEDAAKIVFSKTLKKVTWNNSKLFSRVNSEKVREWKSRKRPTSHQGENANPGQDAVIFGSGTIVKELTKLGLIDEYRILVNPVILGTGKSMFEGVDLKKLELTKTRVFKNGNVLLTYIPKAFP